METTLITALLCCCVFLLWLYLDSRRLVNQRELKIEALYRENMKLIEEMYKVSVVLTDIISKAPQDEKHE